MGLLNSVGGFFEGVGKDIVHTAEDGYQAAAHGWDTAYNAAKNAVLNADAEKAQIGSWINSGEQYVVHKVDEGRAWLRQHGGVAGQVASNYIGLEEGVGISLYDAGKGLVQLADGVESLTNPVEWVFNPGANIARLKAGARAVEGLGKLASLTQPASWVADPQGNERMVSGLWQTAEKNFEADPSKATGYVAGTIATFFIPGGGEATAAGDVGRTAELLGDTTRVTDAANTTGDAGRTAELTDGAGGDWGPPPGGGPPPGSPSDIPYRGNVGPFLFRGDTRSPDVLKAAGGIRPPTPIGINTYPTLRDYVMANVGGRFVGTAGTVDAVKTFIATESRAVREQGSAWIYVVNPGGRRHDVVEQFEVAGMSIPDHVRAEAEIAVEDGGISWPEIYGWRPVTPEGRFNGPFIRNPDYTGPGHPPRFASLPVVDRYGGVHWP